MLTIDPNTSFPYPISRKTYNTLKMMYDAVNYTKVCREKMQKLSHNGERKQILNEEVMTIVLQYVANVSASKAASSFFMPQNYITSVKVNRNANVDAVDAYLNSHDTIKIVEFIECDFLWSANLGGLIHHHCHIDRFIINRCQNVYDKGYFTYTDAIGTTFSSINRLNQSVSVEFKGNWRIFPSPTPSMTPVQIIDIAMASFGTGNYFGHLLTFIDGSLIRFNDYRGMFVSMFHDEMFKILCIDNSVPDTASVFIKSSLYETLVVVLKMKDDCWFLKTVYQKSILDSVVESVNI